MLQTLKRWSIGLLMIGLLWATPTLARAEVVGHPPGCPTRAFCGCGTALYLLGKRVVVGGLAIAANWLAFPRAQPGPGMAAARKGHVFAIIKDLGGGKVLAYDPNSGGRKTRIHVRSLRGYTVVNPYATDLAKMEGVGRVTATRVVRHRVAVHKSQRHRRDVSRQYANSVHITSDMPEKHSVH